MNQPLYIPLTDRGLLAIEGEDARTFLQGLITNDIGKVSSTQSIYACMLSPQGKFLFDFFIAEINGKLVLDCYEGQKEALKKRFTMYKLRSKVTISDMSNEYEVVALLADDAVLTREKMEKRLGFTQTICKGVIFMDPREIALGARAFIERENHYKAFLGKEFTEGNRKIYEHLRISLLVPDGTVDLVPEGSFPLHHRMEEIHAIDYQKGCYVGQEVTARTKHRGVIRKTIYKVKGNQPSLPKPGTPITAAENKTVGELRSSA